MDALSSQYRLLDGRFVNGTAGEEAPEAGAVWRGYFQDAERILTVYATGEWGAEAIAYRLSE
ncbi:MAG: hypothetical protein K8I82_10325, partial [Anaerolineae bacterium]|nr:hypothetical protein [Anaerolineae bacterium]